MFARISRSYLTWLVLLAGALYRLVHLQFPEAWGPDELQYFSYARTLSEHGLGAYPTIVADYIRQADAHAYPGPIRWGYLLPAAAVQGLLHTDAPGSLVVLSTLAGCGVVVMTYALGRDVAGRKVAMLAVVLVSVSPLSAALSRRALQAEIVAFWVLLAVWLWLRFTGCSKNIPQKRLGPALVGVLVLAVASKEAVYFLFPALILIAACQKRLSKSHVFALAAVPVLHYLGLSLLAQDGAAFFRLAEILIAGSDLPYRVGYELGPYHRPVFDLVILAPFTAFGLAGVLWTPIAGWRPLPDRVRSLAILCVAGVAVYVIFARNARFYSVFDPAMRILVAWFMINVVHREDRPSPMLAAGFVCALVVSEFMIFQRIFVERAVYDPVTAHLIWAFDMLPWTPGI